MGHVGDSDRTRDFNGGGVGALANDKSDGKSDSVTKQNVVYKHTIRRYCHFKEN